MALSKITTESLLDGEITAAKFATGVGGKIVQVVHVQAGARASGTTAIPFDDTIPQKTEGDEIMTLAITPTHASNILQIEWICHLSCSAVNEMMVAALFQDTTTAALSSALHLNELANGIVNVVGIFRKAAGTTSETTFKIRVGGGSGTTVTNASASTAVMSGTLCSSITITEILA